MAAQPQPRPRATPPLANSATYAVRSLSDWNTIEPGSIVQGMVVKAKPRSSAPRDESTTARTHSTAISPDVR